MTTHTKTETDTTHTSTQISFLFLLNSFLSIEKDSNFRRIASIW